jgi:hypothetical protein
MTMKLIVEAEFYSTMETFKGAGWLAIEDVVSSGFAANSSAFTAVIADF